MRRVGKYEKMRVRALMQTYITSLLCLVLCVAMFLGTSYAWFTSEVNNVGNEMYIGTLDVGFFLKAKDSEELLNLSTQENLDNNRSEVKFFDDDVRWEPGYTMLETVHIVNEGDLAFKYVMCFTDGTLGLVDGTQTATDGEETKTEEKIKAEAAELAAVAQFFDIWVYPHTAENQYVHPKSYAEIVAPDSGWKNPGTLADVLDGTVVLSGEMKLTDVRGAAQSEANQGTIDGKKTEHVYTIALHMKEDAALSNAEQENAAATIATSLMGKKIGLNVKLVAYQTSSEPDDLGGGYDQMVATEEELISAMDKGGVIALASNIKLTKSGLRVAPDTTVLLDLNGHKIEMKATPESSVITNEGTLTVTDSAKDGQISLTFDSESVGGAANVISNSGVLTINDGKIINNSKEGQEPGYGIDNSDGATLIVNGGEVAGCNGIRLLCGTKETVVTVNDGVVSNIWAQSTSSGQSAKVNGTVILNGGRLGPTYYENYTTVRVKIDGEFELNPDVQPNGANKENVASATVGEYTEYSFQQNANS